ncbi:MAG: nitrite reductase, copper-containing [Chloroflexi bacterium]|nr:MAG: nitrite reductase, copper-containing [Chloroflexota bacterium]
MGLAGYAVGKSGRVSAAPAPAAPAVPPAALPAAAPANEAPPTATPWPAKPVGASQVAADPAALPGPVDWTEPQHHKITLDVVEVVAEIEPGVTFSYMTFGGRIPGPMIRVRQGDTVEITLNNLPDNLMPHNVDLHAVYGPGGGAEATFVVAGQSNGMLFKALYPGAFMYHCAVPTLDHHISSGMFGMIVVEPPEGLPPVNREFYLGQHELYTDQAAGVPGHHNFDFAAMQREQPTYVLLNGEKHALTPGRRGAMQAQTGETARIFFVCGGPNLSSNFHPVGSVWSKVWREGAILNTPERYVQTVAVPPGSCLVAEIEFSVPGVVNLVDHALTRVVSKGMLGVIEVAGEPQPDLFMPDLPGDPTG